MRWGVWVERAGIGYWIYNYGVLFVGTESEAKKWCETITKVGGWTYIAAKFPPHMQAMFERNKPGV